MTLALAIIGTVLGVVNAAMAWWQWRRSGPAIGVSLRAGWYLPGGGIASYEVESFKANPRPDGGQPVVIVRVINRGRSAVDINEWWVTIGPTQLGMLARMDPKLIEGLRSGLLGELDIDALLLQEHNEPCPFRLDSHSSKAWVLRMESVAEVVSALHDDQDTTVSAIVHLGSGRSMRARERVQPEVLGIGRSEGTGQA